MAGVKGRSGGRRPGAGRPKGSKSQTTLDREARDQKLDRVLNILIAEQQARRNQYESLPSVLRRLVEIEKLLQMRERVRVERHTRNQPMGKSAAAERLFKPAEAD
jgi:hypothetical protein